MASDNRKMSIAKRGRKMSVYEQLRNNIPSLNRRSKSSSDIKTDIIESQEKNRRKSGTFFAGAPTETIDNDEEMDYHVRFRKIMREIYAEQEKEKTIIKRQYQQKLKSRLKEQQVQGQNKLFNFVRYMATEHESMLQLLIFMPLILTAFYIVMIEKGSLVTYMK